MSTLLIAAVLLWAAAAAPPARATRSLLQAAGASCPDLVPGGFETVAEVPAGGSATLAAYHNAGPVYLASSAEATDGMEVPSSYSLQLWQESGGLDGGSQSSQAATADSDAAGCATTPVVDFCPTPATATIRVRCLNTGTACRVRVAAYMSACPGGPQPQAVSAAPISGSGSGDGSTAPSSTAVSGSGGGGSSSSSSSSSSGGSQTESDAGAAAPSPVSSGSSRPGISDDSSSTRTSTSTSSGGLSSTTWIIVGASVAAAALAVLLLWCLCCCKRRRRQRQQMGDLEAGTLHHQQPGQAPFKQQQQQFLVSGGISQAPTAPVGLPGRWQTVQPAAPAKPLAAPAAVPLQQGWAFGYKVPKQRLTFATDASRRSGLLQRWETVDGWLAAQLGGTIPVPQGCLLYNDDPPETRADGSPTGYARPVQYRPCGHTKGVVLWGARRLVWLVHSVPKWPCHDPSSASGVGPRGLPIIDDRQTDRGQSFLWVVLLREQLATVLRQVAHMQALVYFASDARIWPYQPKDYTKATGVGFLEVQLSPGIWHLAKANDPAPGFAGHFNFYQELAARYGGCWLVRTNLTQNQGEDGKCASTTTVKNISQLRVPGFDHAPYRAGSEHAKMAVCVGMRPSDNPPLPLVMVGDLNNTRPQWKRGGGGVIVQNVHLSEALRLMVVEVGEP